MNCTTTLLGEEIRQTAISVIMHTEITVLHADMCENPFLLHLNTLLDNPKYHVLIYFLNFFLELLFTWHTNEIMTVTIN